MSARILVVHNDSEMRDMLKQTLTKKGHEVLTAKTGEAAVETILNERGMVHGVIAPLRLPGMDGIALAPLARKHCVDGLIYVILTGGREAAENRSDEVKKAGVSGVFYAPYELNDALDCFDVLAVPT